MKKLILFAGLLVFLCAGLWGATYTWMGALSGGDGSTWSDSNNWDVGTQPGPVDDVTIGTGATVYLDVPGTVNSLTVTGSSTLNLGTNDLGVTTTFELKDTASITGTSGNFTVGSASTFASSADPDVNTGSGAQTYDVIIVGDDISLQGSTVTVNGALDTGIHNIIVDGDTTVTGNVTIQNGATLDIGTYNLTATTITNNGTLTLAGDAGQTVTPATIAGSGLVNFNSAGTTLAGITGFPNLTISAGGIALVARSTASSIEVGGTLKIESGITLGLTGDVEAETISTDGSLFLYGTGQTVTTGAQPATIGGTGEVVFALSSGLAGITTFPSLRIYGYGSVPVTAEADITVKGYLSTQNGGTLDMDGNNLTLEGNLTNNTGAAGLTDVNLLTLSGGNTQDINANGAEITALTLDKTGTATLTGDLSVTGNVRLAGGTLNGGASGIDLTVGGNWEPTAGTFVPGGGTVTFDGATVKGSNTFNDVVCTGTVTFENGKTQTINGTLDAEGTSGLPTWLKSDTSARWNLAGLTAGNFTTNQYTTISGCNSTNALGRTASGGSPTEALNGGNNYRVFAATTYTWTGAGGTNAWGLAANWDSLNGMPASLSNADTLIIDAPAPDRGPTTPGTISIDILDVQAGTLDLAGNALTVLTTLTNDGTIKLQGGQTVTVGAFSPEPARPGGTIHYYGSSSANWPFGNAYTNLIVSAAKTGGGALDIDGTAEFNAGITADSIDVTGTTTIGADITINTTAGNQTYGDEMKLGAFQPTLTSAGSVSANGNVSGTAGIIVNAKTGITMEGIGTPVPSVELSGNIVLNNTGTAGLVYFGTNTTNEITLSGTNTAEITLGFVFYNINSGNIKVVKTGTLEGINVKGSIVLTTLGKVTQDAPLIGKALLVEANKGIELTNSDNNVETVSLTNSGTDTEGSIAYYNKRGLNTDTLLVSWAINTAEDGGIDIRESTGDIKIDTNTVPVIHTAGTGAVTITSGEDSDITINGDVNCYSLALKTGTTIGTGVVTINGGITAAGDVAEGGTAAVYVWAHSLMGNGNINLTGTGAVCVNISETPAYGGNVTGTPQRIHYHSRDGHIVYRKGLESVGVPHGVPSPYLYLNSNNVGGGNYQPGENKNIYIIDVGTTSWVNTFTGNGTGFIEFRGSYDADSVTLNPGTGGLRLNNATIRLTGTGSVFQSSNNNKSVTLEGGGLSSITTGGSITFGGGTGTPDPINGTTAGAEQLTLKSAAITIDGPVGNSVQPGNITIVNSGMFTLNAALKTAGFFRQSGGGTNKLAANITTQNDSNDSYAIIFANAVQLGGNVTLHASTSSGGNITLSAVDSDGTTGRTLELETIHDVTVNTIGGVTPPPGNITIIGQNIGLQAVNSSGKTTITNGALFTANGAITSTTGFEQTSASTGTSVLKANITTTNNNITFSKNIKLNDDTTITLDTGSGAGNIALTGGVSADTTTSDLEHFTLTAGTGNITVNGAMGGSGTDERPGTLTVTNAANAAFNGAIWANNFVQSAGTGTTTFAAAQDYLAGFTFVGAALTINAALVTDTDASSVGDGAISIDNTGDFTVGTTGSILPGGTSGTLYVSGNTQNNGTITAGPIPLISGPPISPDVAVTFRGNYTAGSSSGALVGNSSYSSYLDFWGNAAFNGVTHNNNIIRFLGLSGTDHDVASVGTLSPRYLGNVEIAAQNTVTVVTGSTLVQDDDTTLTLNSGSSANPTTLTAVDGFWHMGTAAPSGFTGFAGYDGEIIFNANSELVTLDFINRATNFDITLAAAGSAIEAGGNVTIEESFNGGSNLDYSTLTMSGTGKTLYVPNLNTYLGNLVVSGGAAGTTLNNNIVLKGTVDISGVLNGNSKNITLLPGQNPPSGEPDNSWTQTGQFVYANTIVEFGSSTESGHTYDIIGDTSWYTLACHENGATLRFSNFADPGTQGHVIYHLLDINPATLAEANMIKLTRRTDNSYSNGYPNSPIQHPPSVPSNFFWFFYLVGDASLNLNYVDIRYSFSRTKIPVPDDNGLNSSGEPWRVDAWPYVFINEATGNAEPGNSNSHWNVDWFVFRNFLYGYTEDSNHNGKVDRIRLQAAFEVINGNRGGFNGFEVSVKNNRTGDVYAVDKSKGYNGYRRVQELDSSISYDRDSIYVLLEEMPYVDTGDRLHWRVERNSTLWDLTTYHAETNRGSVLIGVPANDSDAPADEGDAWDTTPPRITYALALPGHNELYFGVSEEVTMPGDPISLPAGASPKDIPGGGSKEYLFSFPREFTLAELGRADPGSFTIIGVKDKAKPAADLRQDPKKLYRLLYPSPKYPQNYNYDSGDGSYKDNGYPTNYEPYVTVVSTEWEAPPPAWSGIINGVPTDTIQVPNRTYDFASGEPGDVSHRLSDMLVSIPPLNMGDEDYFVWPLWAKYKASDDPDVDNWGITPDYGYMGQEGETVIEPDIIFDFTGRRFLEKNDIVLQSRLNNGLTVSSPPELIWASDISDSYRSVAENNGTEGLWYPGPMPSRNPPFTNLVPRALSRGRYQSAHPVQESGRLYNHELPLDYLPENKNVEFYYRLPDSARLAARLDMAPGANIPGDWYRRVRPFIFGIHEITRQRGGVTILNNVIKAGSERVYIDYKPESSGRVTIQVFTLDGNLVKVLKRGHAETGDIYQRVSWDGTNNGGRPVARGMYFVRVVAPGIDEIRKVMVVK